MIKFFSANIMTLQADYSYDVFISNSHEDQKSVLDEFLAKLKDAPGLNVLLPIRDSKIGVPKLELLPLCNGWRKTKLLSFQKSFKK